MLKRILLCYLGALLIPALCLPIAATWTMGGHSLMFSIVYGVPLGVTAGLWYSDHRRRYHPSAALLRSGFGLLVAVFVVFAVAEIQVSPFWTNNGWVVIPLFAPLTSALVSGLLFRAHIRPQTL